MLGARWEVIFRGTLMGQPSVPVHGDMEMPSGGQEFCHPTLSLSWPHQSLGKPTSSREISLVLEISQWPFILNFVDRRAERPRKLLLHVERALCARCPQHI